MWAEALWTFARLLNTTGHSSALTIALKFFPFAIVLELPLYLLVLAGIIRYALRQSRPVLWRAGYPSISCTITCYSEGEDVRQTILSLAYQNYPGFIQILPVIDGAIQNANTLQAARQCMDEVNKLPNRRLQVIPKWQRGGRVSSLNTGLLFANGEVLMALDGDTSFDNDMVRNATRHLDDPNVVGVAGCLRVRNADNSLAATLQSMEYMLSIGAGKTGLSEFNIVNNISGAFGIFRTSFIRMTGGWDAGTAEDLDITLRIKQYFGRHTRLRIVFDPMAIGHTDVPDTFKGFIKQRWRWDGDLFYIFIRKYRYNLRPRLMGWKNFIFVLYTGLIQQIMMPFIITFYTIALFILFPAGAAIGLLMFIYLIYFAALLILFMLYLLAVSERIWQDSAYLPTLLIYPLFAFFARINSAFAIIQEIFIRSHADSAMAPWWVLRKTKF